ncbi:MAG TPA: long-chain fatty acid--CoA ligase [Pyrinomonadaceae bacterium]|nr:long-chain fatty acid--CoA ligase [Pyrinomonadaceae bacterium]
MINTTSQLMTPLAEAARLRRVPLYEDEPATLAEMFLRSAREHQKPDALSYKRDGRWHSISSEKMIERAREVALGLYSLGVRHGDRVGLLSQNCPEWTLADAGSLFCGAADVPIYSTQTPSQVCYILKDSGARVLFIENRAAFERVRESLKGCDTLKHVIYFDADGVEDERAVALSDLEARGRELWKEQPDLITELERALKPYDLATIIYTSGTTGEPKGVMLTHSNLVSNLLDSSSHLSFGLEDVALSVLPLSHVLERLAMYMYINHGMSVYYAESLEKVGENFREVRPTVFVGVPRLFEKIYQRIKERAASEGKLKAAILNWAVSVGKLHARYELNHQRVPRMLAFKQRLATRLVFHKWRAGMGGRVRLFVSGGAALSEEIGYIFAGAGLPIVQGYGLTETSPVISAGRLEDNRIGTVGRPIRNVEVRIADDGEIETRGPNVMLGYYNKPEETRAVFTEDGWFKTGDIGTLDDDGFLRITDRKKELFKTSGGKYIAPQPIEQLIKGSRFVNQVVLVGNERKFPAALIVPDWEQLQSYAELKGLDARTPSELVKHPRIVNLFERQVNAHTEDLAQFEKVKRIALLEQELTIEGGELTPTMKVKRRVVDEKYKDLIDRLYEEA